MDAKNIIRELGGCVVVARLCDVTPQAVSQWASTGIPKARRQYLALLRPDVFAESPDQQKAAA